MTTIKVMEVHANGHHLECIKDNSQTVNPYRLYKVWWDCGKHRKLIAKYADIVSVMIEATNIIRG